MNNFTPLNFDATSVDPNFSGGGFFPVSDTKGWLCQMVRDDGFKPSRSGDGQYLSLVVVGLEGPVAGQEAVIRLNLQHTKQTAIAAATAQLSALCHVTGVLKAGTTADLMGKPFRVVSVEQAQTAADKEAGKPAFTQLADNGIRDVDGNRPGQASGAQQVQSAAPVNPAQQQQVQTQQPAFGAGAAQQQDPNQGQQGGAPGWGGGAPAAGQGAAAPGWGGAAQQGGQQQQGQQGGGGGAPGWAQG